jgi:hypothetical protein
MRTFQSTRFKRFSSPVLSIAALVAIATLAATPASATTVTLPAAASIQGVAPFFSDVRVFNTSHEATVAVTATYYCFLGDCPATPAQITMDLAPRDSQAFNDIVADAFGAPNSAGGIEFDFDGDQDLIIVTSRLYSTEPNPTVGMFIPGLGPSQAHQLAALPSVQNGGSGAGFRTNVGAYNPNDTPALITFSLLANHAPVGGNVQRVVPAHSGVQVNNIFVEAGATGEDTDNGVLIVQSNVPVFSYAAVIDNNTQDPYLVIGAQDRSAELTPTQPVNGTPTKTRTPVATRTPRFTVTPNNSASPTPTPNASASPLLRRVLNERPAGESPSAAVATAQLSAFPFDARLLERRLLAVLRDPRDPQGGW